MNIETANRLLSLRKKHNLSQEALAEKLGISRQAVSKWERAEASPDTDNLIALARLYEMSLDELLNIREPEPKISDQEKQETNEMNPKQEPEHSIRNDYQEGYDSNVFRPHYYCRRRTGIAGFFTALAITAIYLFVSTIYGVWHPAWILFLFIPIITSFIEAVNRKNAVFFAYPVCITVVYLILGFGKGLWHPGWILFMTIPIYYGVVNYFNAAKNKEQYE